MLISIHDVPRDERHLLFCSRLNHNRRPRRHRRRRFGSSGHEPAVPSTAIPLLLACAPDRRGAA